MADLQSAALATWLQRRAGTHGTAVLAMPPQTLPIMPAAQFAVQET